MKYALFEDNTTSLKFTFPVDIESIYALLTDPDFLVDRNVALGDIESECEAEEAASKLLIKMKRTRDLELPAFLANVLGGNPVFNTEEQWRTVKKPLLGKFNDNGWGSARHSSY